MKDVAAAYYEVLKDGDRDFVAFEAALRVYKGHYPTVREGAARRAVAKIVADSSQEKAR